MRHFNNFQVSIFLLILGMFSGCDIEHSETVRNYSDDGLTIKNGSFFELLEDAIIENTTIVDTIEIEGKPFIKYELEISGNSIDEIRPGTILITQDGMGSLILITEVEDNSLKSASGETSVNGILASGVSATLDMLFNYEGAILQFSTKENRTKRNCDIDGKLYAGEISDEENKFEMETDGESGLSYNYADGLVAFAFNNATFKLKPQDEDNDNEVSASLRIKEGYISINPAMDFLIEYNPKYFEYSDNAWINFLNYLDIQKQLVDKTLALGTLKQLKAINYLDFDYGIDVELIINGKLEEEIFEKKIGQWCQVFFAGPVPIGHQTTISFEVDLSVAGSLSANFWYKQQHDVVLGLDLKNQLNETGDLESNVTYYAEVKTKTDKGVTLSAEIELAAGITLKIKEEVYIAGILGPSGEAGAKIEAYANFWNFPSPYYGITGYKVGVDASLFALASVDLSLFHIDKATWRFLVSKPFEIAKWNIFQYPNQLAVVGGQNQVGLPGLKLPESLQLEVQDNYGNTHQLMGSVPVFFIGEEGGYNGSASKSPVLSNGGIASIDWTLGNQEGDQQMLACMYDFGMETLGESVFLLASAQSLDIPVIISTSPQDGASGVNINSNIEIEFSKNIYFTSSSEFPNLSGTIAELSDEDGNAVLFSASISGNKVILDPENPLKAGVNYSLHIYPEAIHDEAGNRGDMGVYDVEFSTLDDSGLTVEIKDILPEEILEVIDDMDIIMYGGNNPPNVEGTYLISPLALLKSNISTDVIGRLFADIIIQFYDQDPVNLSIKTRDQHAETTGSGSGSFIVGDGNYFTIVGEDFRMDADGDPYCKLAFVISAELSDEGLKNCEYTIVMVDDFGDPDNQLIDIGQLRQVVDQDGLSERVSDLSKSRLVLTGKAIFEK